MRHNVTIALISRSVPLDRKTSESWVSLRVQEPDEFEGYQ